MFLRLFIISVLFYGINSKYNIKKVDAKYLHLLFLAEGLVSMVLLFGVADHIFVCLRLLDRCDEKDGKCLIDLQCDKEIKD